MRNLFIALLVVTTLCFTAIVALATPEPDNATALVTVTVDVIGEWAENFDTIALATMTAQSSEPNGYQTATLYTNGDVTITADANAVAQLKLGTDPNQTLVTSYMLTDDGGSDDGGGTGGTDEVAYTDYATFLASGYDITHVSGDGAVEITLNAKAANPPGDVADAGDYTATQTLTATW